MSLMTPNPVDWETATHHPDTGKELTDRDRAYYRAMDRAPTEVQKREVMLAFSEVARARETARQAQHTLAKANERVAEDQCFIVRAEAELVAAQEAVVVAKEARDALRPISKDERDSLDAVVLRGRIRAAEVLAANRVEMAEFNVRSCQAGAAEHRRRIKQARSDLVDAQQIIRTARTEQQAQ